MQSLEILLDIRDDLAQHTFINPIGYSIENELRSAGIRDTNGAIGLGEFSIVNVVFEYVHQSITWKLNKKNIRTPKTTPKFLPTGAHSTKKRSSPVILSSARSAVLALVPKFIIVYWAL